MRTTTATWSSSTTSRQTLLLSQFIATPSGNPGDDQYGECIAVSTTGDATGSYYLYTFLFGTDVFYDYPKLGVWPDGYYMMANERPTNSEIVGYPRLRVRAEPDAGR